MYRFRKTFRNKGVIKLKIALNTSVNRTRLEHSLDNQIFALALMYEI